MFDIALADAVRAEATALLSDLIRIDSSNPPGNEAAVADYLQALAAREGLRSERIPVGEGRDSVALRLPGDGTAAPLLFLAHTDVVPVEADQWTRPAFTAHLEDGYLYGRGALDMKGMLAMELMAVLELRRRGLALRRDIVLLATGDEEAGSAFGAEHVAKVRPDLLQADACINEGGFGYTEVFGVRGPVFGLSHAEKSPLWLRLRTRGVPGHGSVPHGEDAGSRMVHALARIDAWRRPNVVVPENEPLLRFIAERGVLPALEDEALAALAARNPTVNATTSHTVANTTCRFGIKSNVLAATAEATLDCRLLPGETAEHFIADLGAVIDDPAVEVETIFHASSPVSPLDGGLAAAVRDAVHDWNPDAAVVPWITTGFTDSRVPRRLGVPSYGFIPALLEPGELARLHGNDERISLDNLAFGCAMLHGVARRFCGAGA